MSRVQLALRVGDLAESIAFYSQLFNVKPAKLRPGYANFAITEPALKLVLLEGEPGQATVMDHLGVEVDSTAQVAAAANRLIGEGMKNTAGKRHDVLLRLTGQGLGPRPRPGTMGGLHRQGRLPHHRSTRLLYARLATPALQRNFDHNARVGISKNVRRYYWSE